MAALTPKMLYRRSFELVLRNVAAAQPPGDWHLEDLEIPLHRIGCDRCGFMVDLLVEPFPIGWTTEGDLEHGFVDLCRACSS